MRIFKQEVAQQSSAQPKQKVAITVKKMLWTITLGAAWHISEGPPQYSSVQQLKRDKGKSMVLTTLRHNHEKHMISRVLAKEGEQTKLLEAWSPGTMLSFYKDG